jgi:Cd2+/Zn2+-exporting ATPase
MILSGDNAMVVEQLAHSVGIERFESGLMPDAKSELIRSLSAKGPIGMVGDGINDAPALAQATVGIAMGVGGSAAAIDAADVALMGDDLTRIPHAIRLARATRVIVMQNIAFALFSKLAFVALTVGGYTSLWLAVAADMGASLIVTLNAMQLMRSGKLDQ